MEVEHGVLEDVEIVSKWAIFHFHDYGRTGIFAGILFTLSPTVTWISGKWQFWSLNQLVFQMGQVIQAVTF